MKNKIIKCLIMIIAIIPLAIISIGIVHLLWHGIDNVQISYDVISAICGTMILGIFSTIIASIVGCGCALYLSFYNNKISRIVDDMVGIMAGIPSIIFGLITYFILISYFGLDRSLFCSIVSIAMMILPFIIIKLKKVFNDEVQKRYIAYLSLGFNKEYIIMHLIAKEKIKEIISTMLLSMAYGIGATAPILYTGVVIQSNIPKSFSDPFMALPYQIYVIISNGGQVDYAYGLSIILLLIIIFLQIITKLFLRRDRRC